MRKTSDCWIPLAVKVGAKAAHARRMTAVVTHVARGRRPTKPASQAQPVARRAGALAPSGVVVGLAVPISSR